MAGVPIRAVAAGLLLAVLAAGAPVRGADPCDLDRRETYTDAFEMLMPVRDLDGGHLQRWYRPMIPVYVRNELAVDARRAIEEALADYNRLVFGTNRMRLLEYEKVDVVPDDFMIPLGQRGRGDLDGIFVAIVSDERFKDLGRLVDRYPIPPKDRAASKRAFSTSNCRVYWHTTRKGREIYHATIWIREKSFSTPIRGCLYQELNHALGIVRDHSDVYCTVHGNGRETADELKPLDRTLIEMLYHPAVDATKPWHALRGAMQQLAACAARRSAKAGNPRLAEMCTIKGG